MPYTLITGGNAGIGKTTAIALAEKGHTIIIACRNEAKAQQAVTAIKTATNNNAVHYLICDLASFESVKNCAEKYCQQFGQLDILINNAGLITDKLQFTKGGLELQIGVNHFGHFLLTQLLLDLLQESSEPRIINVSSTAHYSAKINFNTFKGEIGEERYSGFAAYGQSKLANVLFTKELVRRYPNIYSYSLHPGVVGTSIGTKNGNSKWWTIAWKIFSPFMLNPTKGAKTTVYLATSQEVLQSSGKYFEKQQEKEPSALAHDVELAQKLWELSEEMINLA